MDGVFAKLNISSTGVRFGVPRDGQKFSKSQGILMEGETQKTQKTMVKQDFERLYRPGN